ncbi:GNAT family N-acetyltransferase [soil metagenome]
MEIRPAQPDDAVALAKVHVDSWRTTYKGLMPDDYLASLSYAQREQMWRDILTNSTVSTFVYVAEAAPNQIVGFVSGGPARDGQTYAGELYAIYLLDNYQRQGIGRQLMLTLLQRLRQEGMISLLLWVLAENPARQFYEAFGGQSIKELVITIGDAQLIEVAYGWPNIQVILDRETAKQE